MKLVFPQWFYHASLPEGKIVYSQEQYDALGSGWVDTPAKLKVPESKAESKPAPKAQAGSYKEHQEQWESKVEKAEGGNGAVDPKVEAKAKRAALAAQKKAEKAAKKNQAHA